MTEEPDPEQSLRDRIMEMEKERQRREASDKEDRQLNEEMREPVQRETIKDLQKRMGHVISTDMPYTDALEEMARQKAEIEATRKDQERIRTEMLQQIKENGDRNSKINLLAIGIAVISLLVAVVAIFV